MLNVKQTAIKLLGKAAILFFCFAITPIFAQDANQLVGTWQEIPINQNEEQKSEKNDPIKILIFNVGGYYIQTSFPKNRPITTTSIDQRSKEDLLKQFKGMITRFGTYRIAENTLVQTIQSSGEVIEEGREIVTTFRINGDHLELYNHLYGDKPISLYKKIQQNAEEPVEIEKIKWLNSNQVVIRSINPSDVDFTDLEPIKKAIGSAQIVMLGEQSHGDGATFDAKIRLIRFLHEKMGFNILSWESGTYDCEMANAFLKNGDTEKALESSIFGVWAQGRSLPPLFEYMASTHKNKKPLLLTGFDIQFTGNKFDKNKFLSIFLNGLPDDVKNKIDDEMKSTILELAEHLRTDKYVNLSHEDRKSKEDIVFQLITMIKKHNKTVNDKGIDYSLRLLQNLFNLGKMYSDEIDKNFDEGFRDQCMADNLLWLIQNRYQGEKIIVWAASMHISRNITNIDTGIPGISYNDNNTMGQRVWDVLKDKIYSIAFTAYDGYHGKPFALKQAISPALPNSMEGMLKATNVSYSFVDFKSIPENHWLRKRLKARPFAYITMISEWPLNFDAMIFTKTMYNNPRIKK